MAGVGVLGVVERVYRQRISYFQKYNDQEFLQRTRFTKAVTRAIIDGFSNSPFARKSSRNKALEDELTVCIALRYYATGSMFREQSDCGGCSRSTVSRKVSKVTEYLVSIKDQWIRFPNTEEEKFETAAQFFRKHSLPRCIGAVDCTHIHIIAPKENKQAYVNRKHRFSINVQAVVNRDLMFTSVETRWCGSTHDSFIFNHSELGQMAQNREFGDYFLIGDGGYPLRPWLQTPYLLPTTPEQIRFNTILTSARSVVERGYGVLKMRSRVLSKTGGVLMMTPKKAAKITCACMVLHNIAMAAKIPEPDDDPEEDDYSDDEVEVERNVAQNVLREGHRTRNNLARSLYARRQQQRERAKKLKDKQLAKKIRLRQAIDARKAARRENSQAAKRARAQRPAAPGEHNQSSH